MIIEMRTYTIKPGELHNFINIYDAEIREIHTKILGNQIGFFYTEIGNVNEVVHLYGYDSYEDRQSRREILSKSPEFLAYIGKVKDLIVDMKNQLMTPNYFFQKLNKMILIIYKSKKIVLVTKDIKIFFLVK